MSTVLWAHCLTEASVRTDEADKWALHKHSHKLDSLCRKLGLKPFSSLCDTTDARVNLGMLELPAGLLSTNELMASQGVWVDAPHALDILQSLLDHLRQHQIRFGVLHNDYAQVLVELEASIGFIQGLTDPQAKFNFSIVM